MGGSSGVVVKSRSKSLKDTTLDLAEKSTVEDALRTISARNGGISQNRLRLTYLKENKYIPVTSDELLHGDLYVKDLGPQISWRGVFLIEYFGPLAIHSLLYYLSTNPEIVSKWHSKSTVYNPALNQVLFYLNTAHYLKREFESIFIHQFSLATMPLFNVFKNSFHYWILNGAIALSYFGYGFCLADSTLSKIYGCLKLSNLKTLIGLFILFESWNFYSHLKLRLWGDAQKKQGNTKTRVPLNGGIFSIFVAPNYTMEVYAWTAFTLISKMNIFAVIFLSVSTIQLYLWAQKKNKKYGTKRAFLIPFIF